MQVFDNKRVHQILLQATMGFKSNDVEKVHQAGSIAQWVDDQIAVGRSSLANFHQQVANEHEHEQWSDLHFNIGYTDMLIKRNDLLRQRMTYVLTQLFVVSNNAPGLSQHFRRIAFSHYYDELAKACFGNFRDLLKVMSTSPVMGQYLTYLDNDAVEGVAPDENFARELMQLFSIGPSLLRMDGSIVTEDGRPVLSYSQEDIEQGAKVMTGWGLHNDRWDIAMREKDGAHNTQAKTILGHDFPAGASAEQDLDQLLDILCEHDNIAPFIAKFFIQKMVTSNPSPEYIYRVASEFRNSGLEMVTLIKAILSDPEADYSRNDEEDGLIRDPLITLSHAFRALNLTLKPGNNILPNAFAWHDRRFVMDGPSVFYYYKPHEAPSDERFVGLAAPEFKIYNWDDVHHYFRQVSDLAVRLESENAQTYMNRSSFTRHFFETQNDEQLIEELDVHLFASNMSDAMKEIVREFLAGAPRNNGHLRALIIQLLMSPEFMTQG
ncbi:DUF1800 family protein [Vibrio sp. WXL103]|uniref:DUF1800 family protein n=1 Tax=unclassified Vibrio TaxID=2614977 RepID=UPI003EC4BC96